MLYFARWKIAIVALICLAGLAFTGPNFVAEQTAEGLPDWLPHNQINLGLDLQGGSHILLQVDVGAVVKERLESIVDAIRGELRAKRIGYRGLGVKQGFAGLEVRKAEDLEPAMELIRGLSAPLAFNPLSGVGGGRDIEVSNPAGNRIEVVLTEGAIEERKRSALEQSVEIIRRRIDELGTREPTIQRQGEDRILVQLPGEQNPERVKRLLGKTAKLVFRMVDQTTTASQVQQGVRVPPGSELLESDERQPDGSPVFHEVVRKRVMVSGETLVDAQPTTDSRNGQPVVSFRFDAAGAKRFGKATQENVNRRFAIVLDNRVVSAPRILEPILGGSGQISGNFTFQEVSDLALLLRAGALPAPLKILEERTVGPTLGADSVRAGKIASVIGFILVMVFMFLAYGLFGLAANLALLVNMGLIVGALSALQATLTLPGIAGIVLTIGMAVDANVLVFERIREEVRVGKSPINAMDTGYRRVFWTIFDANLTTLIAGVILFAVGSGPIKGFSVTLCIGIVTSVFTAFLLTRMFLAAWFWRARPQVLPI
ncbi:MAG: protein translocase subunit SecD [Alphaproteobacteria bacterium]|jgi:protein-export membrane protein SecD|nr:protein translocase subunit SecD [Alphaproteobacteria bacterium]